MTTTTVNAETRLMENYEMGKVTAFQLNKDLTGYVKLKKCKECATERFSITPNIKAYNYNKEVKLSQFVNSKVKPGTLDFFKDNGKLAGMRWFVKR